MKAARRRTAATLLALLAIGLVAGCASGGASAQQDPALLVGPNWKATQLRGATGALGPVVPGSTISAEFTADSVSGSGSVNRYNATFVTSGKNSIVFTLGATTMMAGPEPLMNQETSYFTALGETKSYVVTAETLSLLDSAGKQLVVFEATTPPALTGQTWSCTGYNNGKGAVVSLVASSAITATFADDKRLSGSAGVNQYDTSYTAEGANMTIAPEIVTTRMAGPEPLMTQEQQYLAALPKTTRYEIRDDELVLWNGDARVASCTLKK